MFIKQFANYIINNYNNEILETYQDQKGVKKNRIKDQTKLENLKKDAQTLFKINNLITTLKTGPAYNCSENPWIHIHNEKNKKGTKGEYLGISFNKENNTIELWLGFGVGSNQNRMRKSQLETTKQNYLTKLKTIEPNLKNGFQYTSLFIEAVLISKAIPINQINEQEISNDLNYLANIYNIYEQQYNSNNFNQDNTSITRTNPSTTDIISLEPSKQIEGKNILYKGFPGTGKSYTVKQKYLTKKDQNNNIIYDEQNHPQLIDSNQYETIVFYPEYTHANFIGSILPTTENSVITYKFVPGPFTTLLKRAIYNPKTNFYLIIEEINRGNAAAIFGELFTLLDRENNGNGRSTYEISNSFIAKEIFNNPNTKIYLPQNFSIIATMNSSDQNVISLDTAFERRWETIWITDQNHEIDNLYIKGFNNLTWGTFRNIINNKIKTSTTLIQSEDKKLGAYFINKSYLTSTPSTKKDDRLKFANKVFIYLYETVCKYNKTLLFNENIHDIDELLKETVKNNNLNIFNDEIKQSLGDINEQNNN